MFLGWWGTASSPLQEGGVPLYCSVYFVLKAQKLQNHFFFCNFSNSFFLDEARELVEILQDFSPTELSKLMGISNNLGLLNADRYINWSLPFNQGNAEQAILTFKGDVYQGIAIDDFDDFVTAFY